MNPWVQPLLILLLCMLPAQVAAYRMMCKAIDIGDGDRAEEVGRDTAMLLGLIFFFTFALFPAVHYDGDWTKFTNRLPFKALYPLAKTYLKVPAGHKEWTKSYLWIWRLLTLLLPAIAYLAVNASMASLMWWPAEKSRHKKPVEAQAKANPDDDF